MATPVSIKSPPRPPSTSQNKRPENYSLEGIGTSVKVLLKLIQEHHDACTKGNDERKMQRVAGMIAILDDVKSRIWKSQSGWKRLAELRRRNADLRSSSSWEKKPQDHATDEVIKKLKRELNESLAARKSLEMMCSSLGKEKEIMSFELSKKVHELGEMEDLVCDLKEQNGTLMTRLHACTDEQEKKNHASEDSLGNAALLDRNKRLSDQLLKSLDIYRSLKRKYKSTKEKNTTLETTMKEIGEEVESGLQQVRSFKQRIIQRNDPKLAIEEEISALERMFECLDMKISKHVEKAPECPKPKTEINASKPAILA